MITDRPFGTALCFMSVSGNSVLSFLKTIGSPLCDYCVVPVKQLYIFVSENSVLYKSFPKHSLFFSGNDADL